LDFYYKIAVKETESPKGPGEAARKEARHLNSFKKVGFARPREENILGHLDSKTFRRWPRGEIVKEHHNVGGLF